MRLILFAICVVPVGEDSCGEGSVEGFVKVVGGIFLQKHQILYQIGIKYFYDRFN